MIWTAKTGLQPVFFFFWRSPKFGQKNRLNLIYDRLKPGSRSFDVVFSLQNSPLPHCKFLATRLPPPRQFLRQKILLNKKKPREMLIEQITEFELRGPGPPGRTCTPTTGYFYDKTKISMSNLSVYYYLLLKCCTRQCTLLPLTWTKSLTKFNIKIQDFKRVLDSNCKQNED